MKILGIIQARLGSTRLPEKIFLDLGGKPMLEIVLERLQASKLVDEWVIATTTNPRDDALAAFAQAHHAPVFRGSEEDLTDRFYQCAKQHKADVIVRATGDNPLVDGDFVDLAVREYLGSQVDYAGATLGKTYPLGLNVEVFGFDGLTQAWQEDKNPAWREHVTPFFYMQPARFACLGLTFERNVHFMRWTVDTPEDLAFARAVFAHFGRCDFGWREALEACEARPDWVAINQQIEQKKV